MAIGTDSGIEFFGTQDQVDSTSALIADGAISVAGDVSNWTNDDDAPLAMFHSSITWGTAPTLNSTIDIVCQLVDVQSTDDTEAPQADYPIHYLTSYVCNDTTTTQKLVAEAALPNVETSQVYTFFLINNTGQQISASWTLFVTPKTIGPHA